MTLRKCTLRPALLFQKKLPCVCQPFVCHYFTCGFLCLISNTSVLFQSTMKRSWLQEWGWPLFTIENPLNPQRPSQKLHSLASRGAHSWSPLPLGWVPFSSFSLGDLHRPSLSYWTWLRPFWLVQQGLSATSHRPRFIGAWEVSTASTTTTANDSIELCAFYSIAAWLTRSIISKGCSCYIHCIKCGDLQQRENTHY